MAVTPLHLMLGRATVEALRIRLEEPVTTEPRLRFLEELRQSFWRKWRAVVFQGLDRSAKWRHEQRDFRKGDVVLLKSETAATATYRLALIECAYPSLSDNKVRKVLVKYKNQGEGDSDFLSGLLIKSFWWCHMRTNNTILSSSKGINLAKNWSRRLPRLESL